MPRKVLSVRAIDGSNGVILPKETLDRLGVEEGQDLVVAEVPGALVLIPAKSELGEYVSDAVEFMDEHDAAFRELSMR